MFFLSNGLYGQREPRHFDFYEQEPRWYFLEIGSRTLEIDLNPAMELAMKLKMTQLWRIAK